ncbi:hypothetical protein HN695_04095 [Candidatus Woesearchaeota archaeon]|jgi:hypothetical protein|nr:hypothetical protein [Candidatus Woesearchaeota archaeon]MBT5272330.1 hypothetical protein [Candidatus Woesearchaeota archaeon]MBT6040659.1 hypothetical protein [Candidatus Woesearchaeota archaeon]MBT6336602.1 hypothetical protein [Candidatus Woesearchaeota archaeon]MBT7927492.1 hypothetical protein [Candidatus Woesearchaeota archaeon]
MNEEEFDPSEEERNVYNDKSRSSFVENDEISPEEEAFMRGYDEADEDNAEEEVNSDDDDGF